MKLVSYINDKNQECLGVFFEGKTYCAYDLGKSCSIDLPQTMGEFLQDSESNLIDLKKAYKNIASGKYTVAAKIKQKLAPVPHPTSCRDAYAFRQHVQTMRKNRGADMAPEFDQFPVFYFSNHNATFGEGIIEVQDDHLNRLDYELEVAVVIGKGGRNISVKDADEYILGYTIWNDFSARTLQLDEMKLSLGPAKGKDFANSFGPWLVTCDELEAFKKPSDEGNRYDLRMNAKLNGKQISEGNMSTMNWTFAQIISRVSYGTDILPGDIIGSGTVGTGCLAELNGTGTRLAKQNGTDYSPVWLDDGDEIAMQIEAMGTLSNTIKRVESPYSLFTYKK